MTVGAVGSSGGSEAQTPADRKLVDGAREFEAMLLGEMLKPLHFGRAEATDEDDDGGAAGTVQSLGVEAMSKAIAAGGGLGVAREILREVRAKRDAHEGNGLATKV